MYAFRSDVEEICKDCEDHKSCVQIEDDCGCISAFLELVWRDKKILYESELRRIKNEKIYQ